MNHALKRYVKKQYNKLQHLFLYTEGTESPWLEDNKNRILNISASLIKSLPSRKLPEGYREIRILELSREISKQTLGNINGETLCLFEKFDLTNDEYDFLPTALKISLVDMIIDMLQGKNYDNASAAVKSLILFPELDFDEMREKCLEQEKLLLKDEVYLASDSGTRAVYRNEISRLSKKSGKSEKEICEIAMLNGSITKNLFSKDNFMFLNCIGLNKRNKQNVFFYILFTIIPAVVCAVLWWLLPVKTGARIILSLASIAPAMVFFNSVINRWVLRTIRPHKPMRLKPEFSDVPENKTAVTLTVMFSDKDSVKKAVKTIEEYYLGNKLENGVYLILADLKESDKEVLQEDEYLKNLFEKSIEELNERYGNFFGGIIRARQENGKKYSGWERKRGAIEQLVKFIKNDEEIFGIFINKELFKEVKYICTLDGDTVIPPDSIIKLLGVIAHPINKDKGLVQPLIGTMPERQTPFQKILAPTGGIDAYSQPIGEVYNDLFNSGTFCGKGIFDVDKYNEKVKIQPNTVLSHDLLEGEMLSSLGANDVVFLDEFPKEPISYYKRKERWLRGDWLLVPYLFSKIKPLSKWKIFFNLVQSQFFTGIFIKAVVAPFFGIYAYLIWALCLFELSMPTVFAWCDTLRFSMEKHAFNDSKENRINSVKRSVLNKLFLPLEAWIGINTMIKGLWRRFVSHKKILEWSTFASTNSQKNQKEFFKFFLPSTVLAILFYFVCVYKGVGIILGLIALSLWLLTPYFAFNLGKNENKIRQELMPDDVNNLKILCARTLRFFHEALEDNEYLMPDNLQLKPYKGYAKRTSPTNLGFALLSVPCGLKAGIYSPSYCVKSLKKQIDAIKKLDTFKGHLYNWYDLNLKRPMGHYVSSVDSGNYCAALITIKGSVDAIKSRHVFSKPYGIGDAIYSCLDSLPEDFQSHLKDYADSFYELSGKKAFEKALSLLNDGIIASVEGTEFIISTVKCWTDDYKGLSFSDKIFKKIEDTKEFNLRPLKEYLNSFPKSVSETLSISDFDCQLEERVWSLGREKYKNLLKEIRNEFQKIYNYAYSINLTLDEIEGYIDEFLENIDFGCLYNPKKKLLAIGMDKDGRSVNCYDMLVSEARLTSYIAIALGKIPAEHWFSLLRPFTRVMETPLCLSWSGTMFEYLMPDIFIKPTENSMLSVSNKIAVKAQMEFCGKNGLWGISESAFNAFDVSGEYKYKAFGVQKTAISSEKSEKVFSPYSTMLAFEYEPEACMENIARFVENGCAGIFGIFEALDTKRPGIVYSHMAHHSGMGLTALTNYLYNGAIRKMFSSVSNISASKVLLEEKMPLGVLPRKELKENEQTEPLKESPYVREFIAPDKQSTETLILTGGQVRGEVSSKGRIKLYHGVLFIGEAYLYVKDEKTKSISYLPVKEQNVQYKTIFYPEKAEFSYCDNIENSSFEFYTLEDSNEFLWRVKVKNKKEIVSQKEIMLFIKPALNNEDAFNAHPYFNGLFIEAEKEENTLKFRNRKTQKEVWLSSVCEGDVSFQTNAMDALGRGNDFSKPACAFEDFKKYPITPLMCINKKISFERQEEKSVDFLLTMNKKSNLKNKAAVNLSCDNAKIYSNGVISAFALTKEQWLLSLKIASIKDSSYRNAKGSASPDTLWQYGISDSIPLLTLLLPKDFSKEKLKFVLKCTDYLMSSGSLMQVLIIEDTVGDYLDGAFNYTDREICALISKDKIYHIKRSGISDEKLREILCMSFLKINVEGDITEQIIKVDSFIATENIKVQENKYPPSKNEDFEGTFDNGFGKFINDGKEYFIYKKTPVPWVNVISNENFGTLLCENGGGYSWQGNSALNKLSPWYNDAVTNPLGEALYLRDNKLNRFWSITRDPVDSGDDHSTVFGKGYAVYSYNGFGMNQKQTVFVHKEKSIKVIKVDIENIRDLSAFYFIKPVLGEKVQDAFKFIEVVNIDGMLCAKRNNEYMFIYAKNAEYCDNEREFFGNGDIKRPQAVYNDEFLKCSKGKQLLALKIKAESSFTIFMGYAKSIEELKSLKAEVDNADVDLWLDEVKNHWEEISNRIQIKTPDEKLNTIFNNWLYYQCFSSRLQARCGFYQAGGAFGFRDQLQDSMMLVISDPEYARNHILKCAAHQFKEGDVQHWWHEPYLGVRTLVSDDLLFLPYVTAFYVRSTGDTKIFDEVVPFLEGHSLSGRDDLYENAWQSDEKSTLYEHCIRAIKLAISRTGENGLPLILGGDWNDGMNNLGKKGKGESVWLGWFLFTVISDLMPYVRTEGEYLKKHAQKLYEALNTVCWDGQWYLRAFDDEGRKIGSQENECAQIDVISQAWSVLSGAGKYAENAMKSVEKHLIDTQHGIVKLLTPPFSENYGAGYICDYIPGIRENGGQYTHGALWVARAFFEMGQSEKGYEILDMINPISHSFNKSSAQRYMLEPYSIPADIYSNEENMGRGGWNWYTASASLYFTTVLSGLLGINMEDGKITVNPHIPPSWNEFFVKIDTPLHKYDIKVLNPSKRREGTESITEIKKDDKTEIRVVM